MEMILVGDIPGCQSGVKTFAKEGGAGSGIIRSSYKILDIGQYMGRRRAERIQHMIREENALC